jgi:hypothetical protein
MDTWARIFGRICKFILDEMQGAMATEPLLLLNNDIFQPYRYTAFSEADT